MFLVQACLQSFIGSNVSKGFIGCFGTAEIILYLKWYVVNDNLNVNNL